MTDKIKNGFTLIEILIATVLVFLLFAVMYGTFFSVSNTTERIQSRMKTSEVMFRFLNKFSREVKCMIREEKNDIVFDSKTISFITMTEKLPYPVRITYTVKKTSENFEKLLRKQEDLLSNYSFSFSVIDDCDSINFLFYSDGVWRDYIDKPEKVIAIGLEIYREAEKLFFPVRIYGEVKDEEKK
ncbi:MAG: prepilin-type N-terminal cleavage/methylation domain-containing protein [Candidatus Omnitrophica bacterium]|nr:prepilin-type N-terminal cleavage/methylation domain-containing protein [Candidatus Omnitrophota bacterium]MCM8777293.1 prepilin-type N-terminal cleavage/methylation domain-containing protein [Candidatus Omnitrophota bacterium]